eukprot:UC4_evm1s1223
MALSTSLLAAIIGTSIQAQASSSAAACEFEVTKTILQATCESLDFQNEINTQVSLNTGCKYTIKGCVVEVSESGNIDMKEGSELIVAGNTLLVNNDTTLVGGKISIALGEFENNNRLLVQGSGVVETALDGNIINNNQLTNDGVDSNGEAGGLAYGVTNQGVITNNAAGTIDNRGNIKNLDRIINHGEIQNLGLMQFHGGKLDNNNNLNNEGTIEVKDSTMENSNIYKNKPNAVINVLQNGIFNNLASGKFTVEENSNVNVKNGGSFSNSDDFTNMGTTLIIDASFKNSGNVTITTGIFLVVQEATYKQSCDSTCKTTVSDADSAFENGAKVTIQNGDLDTSGKFSNFGTLIILSDGNLNILGDTFDNHNTLTCHGTTSVSNSDPSTQFTNTHIVEGTGTLDCDAKCTNVGDITISTFDIAGEFVNDRFASVTSDQVTIDTSSAFQKKSSSISAAVKFTVTANGVFTNQDDAAVECSGSDSAAVCTFEGTTYFLNTARLDIAQQAEVTVSGEIIFRDESTASIKMTAGDETEQFVCGNCYFEDKATLDQKDIPAQGECRDDPAFI